MTYSNTNTFDLRNVGYTLTLRAEQPEAGVRLSVPDPCLDLGIRFRVVCVDGCASYRYIAAEGTGIFITVSAPESPVKTGSRRKSFRQFGVRRFVAPRVGRVFALRL